MIKRQSKSMALVTTVTMAITVSLSGCRNADSTGSDETEVQPVAHVQTVPIKEGSVEQIITAYGTVEAAAGESQSFSVPFECRILRVLVVNGQQVKKGDPLVELEPSPDTRLALEQAKQQQAAASNELNITRQRLELKLAAQLDVAQAEQSLSAAQLTVRSLEERGIDGRTMLQAAADSIVNNVNVQQGQILPAGTALIETIGQNKIIVRLGMESEETGSLCSGQNVRIEPVNDSERAFNGTIRGITREVDPVTRLVNAYVTPESGARLLLNDYVRGRIATTSCRGLVVPSDAVLPLDEGHVLFTVEDGHAVKHIVTPGPENRGLLIVAGDNLKAGARVVTVGNTQLENGMAVDKGNAQ